MSDDSITQRMQRVGTLPESETRYIPRADDTGTGSHRAARPEPVTSPGAKRLRFGYQPALDGIRALAVLAVIAFHGGVTALPGGFLGVDAFFVLSGFLITSLLLAERLNNGRINLPAFWGRRIRRLFPALLLMLIVTVVLARFLLDPQDVQLLRGDALAAIFYVANWRMIYRGDSYFAQTATPSALQHTWSLGIEEQFYLIWPLLVVAVLFLARRRPRRVLLMLTVTGAIASAVAQALLYNATDVNRSYFGTDTRAVALLIGCSLAVIMMLPKENPSKNKYHGRRVAPRRFHPELGAGALIGAAVVVLLWLNATGSSWWLYRGGMVAGALGVAAVIAHAVRVPTSPTARILAVPPLVWLGRISYGVYLWHWPLFQFINGERTGMSGWPLLGIRVAVTLAISTVSFFLVEEPIRRGRLLHRGSWHAPVTAVSAAALTAGIVVIATAVPAAGVPRAAAPIPTTVPSASTSASATIISPMDRPGRKPGALPRIDFLGDSVSWSLGTYLPAYPKLDWTVQAIEGCGIATLPDILELGTPHTNYPGCTSWPSRWQAGVDKYDPDVSVILLNRWELMDRKLNGTYQHVGEPQYDAYLLGQLATAIKIAGSHGARVVLLTAMYTHRAETPSGGLYPEDQPQRVDAWNKLLYQAQAQDPQNIDVLNLNKVACPNGVFTWTINGIQVRSDGLHFTPEGVQRIVAPWLLPQLLAIATGKQQ